MERLPQCRASHFRPGSRWIDIPARPLVEFLMRGGECPIAASRLASRVYLYAATSGSLEGVIALKDKSQTGGHKLCRQRLYVDGVLVARCQVRWGVNHSHPSNSGKAIAKMVELGEARYVRHSIQGHPGHSVKV
jgi:hypothetical protein